MVAPIIVAGLATVARYLAKHGATKAIKMYGKRQVKSASQKMTAGPAKSKLDPTFRPTQSGRVKGTRPADKPGPQPKNTPSYKPYKQTVKPTRAPKWKTRK